MERRSSKSNPSSQFAARLLDWYAAHARQMPWRIPPADHARGVRANPYHVWLSEVMLQQTQVVTVIPYFQKFITSWPDVAALANAPIEDVLRSWAGLGYYSRARNLKRCADTLVEDHGSNFPQTREGLIKLPGIGDYTASAIAAIAFDEAVPVIDGNVERVMTRYLRITTPLPGAKPKLRAALSGLLDRDTPGEFAQAMMDLGATVCTPKKPACSACPLSGQCEAHLAGDAENFPVKPARKAKPKRRGAAYVLFDGEGRVFLTRRPDQGLLAGMTQVPTTGWTAKQDGALGRDAGPVDADWEKAGTARHTFTHFHLELEVWKGLSAGHKPQMEGWWCDPGNIASEALPTVMRKVLAVAAD